MNLKDSKIKGSGILTLGKPFDTKGREMYMVVTSFNSMLRKFDRGEILFVAYETDEQIGFCTKHRQAVIIIKQGNPTFTTDFIKIGICPININE